MGRYFVGKPKLFGNGKVWDFADAFEAAQNGDVIELEAGFNPEGVNLIKIDKSISIEGNVDPRTGDITNNFGGFIITGEVEVKLSNVILNRFEGNVLNVQDSATVVLDNVIIDSGEGNKFPSIYVKDSGISVTNSTILNKNFEALGVDGISGVNLENDSISGKVSIFHSSINMENVDISYDSTSAGLYLESTEATITQSNIIGGAVSDEGTSYGAFVVNKGSNVNISDSWVSSIYSKNQANIVANKVLVLEHINSSTGASLEMNESVIGGLQENIPGKIALFMGGTGNYNISSVAFGNISNPLIKVARKAHYQVDGLSHLEINDGLITANDLLESLEKETTDLNSDENVELFGDEPAYDELNRMVGLTSVKKKVDEILATANLNKQKREAGMETSVNTLHSLFLGNPGTGKTTVARLFGKILFENGLIASDNFNEVSRADLVGQYIGQTAVITKQVLEDSLGGVLFVDEAYTLFKEEINNDFGKEAIDEILAFMENHREDIVIIFAGYTKEMQDFLRANPGLRSRIPHDFIFEDFSADELAELGLLELRNKDYIVDGDDYGKLVHEKLRLSNDNSNGRWIRNLNEELLNKQSFRLSTSSESSPESLREITLEDMNSIVSITNDIEENETASESAYDQLMALTGLETVKKQIDGFIAMAQINKSREEHGLSSNGSSLHSLFLGNPGTGKTTVARLLGKILCDKEITQKSTFKEVSRADLVGQYIGQTAKLTKRVLEDSLGGVLFIDEAYTLFKGHDDSNDFGKEAIDEILAFMENHREDIVIIFAGYDKEMQEFLTSNPGLKSRIPNVFNFEDYSVTDLVHLGLNELKNGDYVINEDSYANLVDNNHDNYYDNSNGRWIRNLNEELIKAQSFRVSLSGDFSKENLTTITDEDIESAYRL